MNRDPVEEFIQARVLPQYHGIVAMLRRLMRECAPDAQEVLTYGILGWRGRRMLAVISPTKKGITFAFSRGAEFDDNTACSKGWVRCPRTCGSIGSKMPIRRH